LALVKVSGYGVINTKTSKEKRILIVGPVPPPFGGIATVIYSIINSELSKEYVFDIFNRSESIYDSQTSSFQRKLLKAKRVLALFRQLWLGKYEFIHIHGSTSGFLGDTMVMVVAFLASSRVLLHLHGTDWEKFYGSVSMFRRIYVRIGLAIPRRIVVLYDLWAQNIRKLDPRINVRVIRNFIPDCPKPEKASLDLLRTELGIGEEEFLISSIGRVGWRKGSFDIVQAVKQLLVENSNFMVLLVGGEELQGEMNDIKKAVDDNGLGHTTKLIGEIKISDVPLYLGISDVFLLPSYYEGMPMSIIEAMRGEKPIIATRVGAIPDMIESGVSGILINPGHPEEIATAIIRLRNEPILKEKIAKGARNVFEQRFETSKVVLDINNLYKEMIE
jgi:glycosyltransferase involved in cell wall biosynthesis